MPIEFRCTQCDRLLRTPDGTSGKDAKCPQCGTIVKIPSMVAPDVAPQTVVPPPPPPLRETIAAGEAQNPYQSPAAAEMRATAAPGDINRGFRPTRIDMGDVLGRTWQIYTANLWPCVFATALLVFFHLGSNGVSYAMAAGDQGQGAANVVGLLILLASLFLMLGVITFMLKVARGEPAELGDVFSAGPVFLPALGAAIIIGVLCTMGFCLLFIPGVIAWLMFSQSFRIIIDKRVGVVDAMRMSMEATRGNKLTLLALYSLMTLIVPTVAILTCGIGAFFAYPFAILLMCVSYLAMTGQSTADQVVSTAAA